MVLGDALSLHPLRRKKKKKKVNFKAVTIVDKINVAFNNYNQTLLKYLVNREPRAQTVNVRPQSSLLPLVLPLPPHYLWSKL